MRDKLRTTVAQFSSSGGLVQPRAANVRAVEPAPDVAGAERGNLYMLMEVLGSGEGTAALYRQVLNAAQTAFYEASGTVASALNRAVRSAHLVLVRVNEALPEAGWRAGISMVAVRNGEAYVAQAGPGLVMISHPSTIDQYPDEPGHYTEPLGSPQRNDVDMFPSSVEPGSMILLAESKWLVGVRPEALAVVTASDSVSVASGYLAQLAGNSDLSALLIGFAAGQATVVSDGRTRDSGQKAAPVARVPEPVGRRPVAEVPVSPQVVRSEPPVRRPARPVEPPRSEPVPVESATPVAASVETVDHAAAAAARTRAETAAPMPTPVPAQAARRWSEPVVEVGEPTVGESADEAAAETVAARGSVLSRLRKLIPTKKPGAEPSPEPALVAGEDTAQGNWEPGPVEQAEQAERPEQKRSAWPLLLALVIIPLIIAAVVLGMFWFRTQAAEKQFMEQISGAEAAITSAETTAVETDARAQLVVAHDFLEKARALRPDDDRFLSLQRAYRDFVNRIDHVTPLYGLLPLWEFSEEGNSLRRAVHGGDSLFVLDSGLQQVVQFKLGQLGDRVTPADNLVVIQRSQQIASLVVSDLLDMTWTEAVGNQHSRLVVLDSAKTLLSLDATFGATRLPIAAQDQWRKPELIMGYGGNLYLVDSEGNQVWRYRPSQNGYENEPESYFKEGTQVSLTGVRSIAIDGSVWLLFSDGRLLKFFAGEQKPFVLNGVPNPLSNPTDVVAPLEGDQLYIADAGNGRIVEFTKEGEFLRQFRPPEGDVLYDMRGLYLDETFGVFYIMTDDVLYKADLPEPASAAAAS